MDKTEDLGMPTLTSRVTNENFSHLCEKINRRLAGWKTKYLSLAGRITLAQSTLSTLANYPMQTAKIPRAICDDLNRKMKKFIWGGNEDKGGTHLLLGKLCKNQFSKEVLVFVRLNRLYFLLSWVGECL